jgi:TadE-like protein
MRHLGRGRLADDRGVALVEFALVLPMLLLILFAMVDMGKAISYWNDQTHLANEAARYAAVNHSPVSGQSIETVIKNQAVTSELKSGSGGSEGVAGGGLSDPNAVSICFVDTLSPGVPDTRAGHPIKAIVKSTYNWLGFLFGSGIHSDMTGASTMRLERDYDNSSPAAWPTNAYAQSGPTLCP